MSHVEASIDYTFKNPNLLLQAMTHPSADSEFNYERLEFLGDAVLGLVISHKLFEAFPNDTEGDLSRKHNSLVMRKSLVNIFKCLGISDHIIMSSAEKNNGGMSNLSTCENIIESIIGAIFLDSGIHSVYKFVDAHWGGIITGMNEAPIDSKTDLQEWTQKKFSSIPVYEVVSKSGADHEPVFCVSVSVWNFDIQYGKGKTKREAEQSAASKMLNLVKNISN